MLEGDGKYKNTKINNKHQIQQKWELKAADYDYELLEKDTVTLSQSVSQ